MRKVRRGVTLDCLENLNTQYLNKCRQSSKLKKGIININDEKINKKKLISQKKKINITCDSFFLS